MGGYLDLKPFPSLSSLYLSLSLIILFHANTSKLKYKKKVHDWLAQGDLKLR